MQSVSLLLAAAVALDSKVGYAVVDDAAADENEIVAVLIGLLGSLGMAPTSPTIPDDAAAAAWLVLLGLELLVAVVAAAVAVELKVGKVSVKVFIG